jgi:subtilisin-like proprotein convertase family protein
MKIFTRILGVSLVFASGYVASAAYSYSGSGFANGGVVPDNNMNGWQNTIHVADLPLSDLISNDTVKVTLNISGGYNGDLYAYLVHGSGYAVLLNRVGVTGVAAYDANGSVDFGSAGSGFAVTYEVNPTSIADIHTYLASAGNPVVSSSVGVDGREINPGGGNFAGSTRTALLTSFNGASADGDYVLYVVDFFAGDQSQVTGWSVSFDTVPEPATYLTLALSGALLGFVQFRRTLRKRNE